MNKQRRLCTRCIDSAWDVDYPMPLANVAFWGLLYLMFVGLGAYTFGQSVFSRVVGIIVIAVPALLLAKLLIDLWERNLRGERLFVSVDVERNVHLHRSESFLGCGGGAVVFVGSDQESGDVMVARDRGGVILEIRFGWFGGCRVHGQCYRPRVWLRGNRLCLEDTAGNRISLKLFEYVLEPRRVIGLPWGRRWTMAGPRAESLLWTLGNCKGGVVGILKQAASQAEAGSSVAGRVG